ncbi:MAG: M3 family metallopeptidase, partial [Planctomycetota bacterium]
MRESKGKARDLSRVMGLFLFSVLTVSACADGSTGSSEVAPSEISGHENPLLAEWHTDFLVPPFDLIENEHYEPAFREAMALHTTEIEAIVANPDPATFQNTIVALDRAGELYGRVGRVFGAVNGAHTNETLQAVAETMAPERAAHGDAILLNPDLWARVDAVFQQREELGLKPEQAKLLEETHKGFVRSGAALDEASKTRIKEINSELALSSTKFSQNVLAEENSFELLVTDSADLGNLPAGLVALASEKATAKGYDSGWLFTLDRPSINPFLEASPNRELRRQMFMGYALRGDNDNENDNKELLSRIAALRAERAKLMGYPTHA